MLLHELVETWRAVESKSSRLSKIEHLADCLRRLEPREIPVGVRYLYGELPQGKIGLGHAAVRDALSDARSAPELALLDVDAAFATIASLAGAGSGRERRGVLSNLLGRATLDEQEFIRRLIIGELRQGAQEGIMVDALARAAGIGSSSIRRALMLASDMSAVAEAALSEGEPGVSRFRLQLFRPVGPMLAQTAEDSASALAENSRAAAEFKLDGARIQVHREGEQVRVFTRGMHDVSARVPEVIELVRQLPARELILDGEAIALGAGGRPLPFQVTMRRFGRKLDVGSLRDSLPLSPAFFDILRLDGRDVFDESAEARFSALDALVPENARVPRQIVTSVRELSDFSERALAAGHEGVMVKVLEASYEAGRRGAGWLKLKPAHTLDLVVLAAEWGSGRRTGFLSNLHLGARDPASGGFVMLGKTFKGMTDAILQWQTEQLLAREVTRDSYTVYVRPELVVEIAFDGVQESSHYPGGVTLRFARVKRYRSDKRADEADTIASVRQIHTRSLGT